jgi:hypothetical protein
MSKYPQSRAARQGLGIGARGKKGEKLLKGWIVHECESCDVSMVTVWKNASRKQKLLPCGCKVFPNHIHKLVYDYPSLHQNEIEMLERCLAREA